MGIFPTVVFASLVFVAGCGSPAQYPAPNLSDDSPLSASGLILGLAEGERRVRRWGDRLPNIIKVDRRNGGSPDMVLLYQELPPGGAIGPHRHLQGEEIIFIHRGSGVATVGKVEKSFSEGATIYIPRNTRVTLRNTGSTPLAAAYVFSKPGFEEYIRETSVLEGQPVTPMSTEERARVREKHRYHVVYEQQ